MWVYVKYSVVRLSQGSQAYGKKYSAYLYGRKQRRAPDMPNAARDPQFEGT
jgi:hypothetical protein